MIQKPKKLNLGRKPRDKFDAWLKIACSSAGFWRAPGPCDHAVAERLVASVIVQGSKDAGSPAFPHFRPGECPACAVAMARAEGHTFVVVHEDEVTGPPAIGTMRVVRA